MLAFFTLAARSRNRQKTFRTLLTVHLIALAFLFAAMVGLSTLILTRIALRDCDTELRGWYQTHHGLRASE